MRRVVYSVCTGTSQLPAPPVVTEYPHLLFTDQQDVQVPGWITREIHGCATPVYMSREYKIKFFEVVPEFDESIYVDTKLQLKNPAALFAYGQSHEHVVAMRHAYRTCVYEELRAIADLHKAPSDLCAAQSAKYTAEKIPEKSGMWACGIVYRRNTPEAVEFSRRWWDEFSGWPYRDQPAFAVAAYASAERPGTFPGNHKANKLWRVVCT